MEDVINEVRELFLDEGVDEQVLMELKTVRCLVLWWISTCRPDQRLIFKPACCLLSSCGRVSWCSPRRWMAFTRRSSRFCKLNSSRPNKLSWRRHNPNRSKSSCLQRSRVRPGLTLLQMNKLKTVIVLLCKTMKCVWCPTFSDICIKCTTTSKKPNNSQ